MRVCLAVGLAALLLAGHAPAAAEPRMAARTPEQGVQPRPPACAPGAPCTWQRTFGGAREDKLRAAAVLPNGDAVLVGKTRSHTGWRAAGWVLRIARTGEVIWQQSLGGGQDVDAFTDVAPGPDGSLLVAGHARTQGAGESDAWLVKLTGDGRVVWQRTFGGRAYDRLLGVAAAPDGGAVAVGFTNSEGAGGRDVWALRVDANGNRLWARTYGGPGDDGGHALALHPEAGAVTLAGYSQTPAGEGTDASGYDAWLARVDLADGTPAWTRRIDRSRLDGATAMTAMPDGGVLAAAITSGAGFGQDDVLLLRLGADGALTWERTAGGPRPDTPWAVSALPGGGAIVAASTQSRGAGSADAWLLRLTDAGEVAWERTYGGDLWDWPGAALAADGGGLLIAGYTTSRGAGYEDGWVLRLDADGHL